jgi:putative ABC transport system permease protein
MTATNDDTLTPIDVRRDRTSQSAPPRPSHLRIADVFGVGSVGIRTRRLRTALTAIGVAIGISALVAVMGISASSSADLLAKLNALGTNRLEVQAGASFTPGGTASLTDGAIPMIRRIGAVTTASGITTVTGSVRRSSLVDQTVTNGISISATDSYFPAATGATIASGRFLDPATERYPAIVLGATAAQRLGIHDVTHTPRVYVTGNWFDVVGILNPITLLPNLDSGAFIGYPVAEKLFATAAAPDTVFVVTVPNQVDAVRGVLGATANPQSPGEVSVSRPSDAIAAKNAASSTFTALLLGLGGIALLVGGIGIANVMVISVLERRTEIGVRRALGATKRHVRLQFLVEAMLLSALGGAIGVVLGVAITIGYTKVQHIVLSIPALSLAAGIGAALLVGAIAGISPAARAARLAPADAIRPI